MAERQQILRSRARLWLRSEKALGLSELPVMRDVVAEMAPASPRQRAIEPAPGANRAGGDAEMMARRAEVVRALSPTPAQAPLTPGRGAANRVDAPAQVKLPADSPLMPPPSTEPFTAPVLSTEQKRAALAEMDQNEVNGCTRCRLCEQRTQTVFGEGDPDAALFFIGEGPGENEDLSGRPFVGRAGEKLNDMIRSMGLRREQVYIANIVKCRPPGNRAPMPDEVATCTPFLERQLEIVRPRVIVTLGLPAAKHMLQTNTSMGRLRGNWHTWRGIRLMPTFHPAYILRNYTREIRSAVWSDLQQVMNELGLPPVDARGPGN